MIRTIILTSAVLASVQPISKSTASSPSPSERAFLSGNQTAMRSMMAGMDTSPTGDVDADFVNMMEPHHQGAIDMAVLELRYGRNEQVRRIAQGIIVEQRQDINAMRLALGRPMTSRESVR